VKVLCFDKPVDFIEKERETLNFINDHKFVLLINLLSNPGRILTKSEERCIIEKIINFGSFEGFSDER
jgi:hypothetical protein